MKNALKDYLSALETFYPPARGTTGIVVRADRMIVNTPLPTRARERMRLFDQMAEVGTRLLIETGVYIILEQSQAAVDMLGHRLVPTKHMDLK